MNKLCDVEIARLKDLFCCAFEGGCNYWIDLVDTPPQAERPVEMEFWHEAPIYGLALVIHHDRDQKVTMDRATLCRGIAVMKEKYPKHWQDFTNENEDAITGDLFVQCCVFGQAIYG